MFFEKDKPRKGVMICRKRQRVLEKPDPFERLPDDLVICILSKLSFSSSCPLDFVNALLVCKRYNKLGQNQLVLSKASSRLFAIRAKNWSESAHCFLKLCVDAGSVEAAYFLGMIRFYCLKNIRSGASLMAKAAIKSYAPALYSLAVIQFNGSGGAKSDKDLRAGVALCVRAAFLDHVEAVRELGHCLQDGYGVKQNITEGRRLLIQANARELISVLPSRTLSSRSSHYTTSFCHRENIVGLIGPGWCSLLSDFGSCNMPAPEPHPVNRFLIEWFGLGGRKPGRGLMLCSNSGCGRPETRAHEFRRCSVCGTVNYCSRACQAQDWKFGHKVQCFPVVADFWLNMDPLNVGADPHGGAVGAHADDHYHHQLGG